MRESEGFGHAMETEEEGQHHVPNSIEFMEEDDLISALPDCLLVEILSRLHSIEGAIRAGTLSKRWKHIWTLIPSLCFYSGTLRRLSDFVLFVDKTLTQCPQFKLKEFEVQTVYYAQYESQVKTWIRYAISCNVEVLNLKLWSRILDSYILLDQSFLISSCFTDLTLQGCTFNPVGAISWNNLRRLSFSFGNLDKVLIENIISGSPQLETLVLYYCYGFRRLDIKSKSVKNLVFSGYYAPNHQFDSNIIEINAPCILSLTVQCTMYLSKLLLLNVSSLVKAILDYTNKVTTPKEAEEEMLKGFILNLRHVKVLQIWASCSEVLSRLEAKGFIFPSNMKFSNVTYERSDSD